MGRIIHFTPVSVWAQDRRHPSPADSSQGDVILPARPPVTTATFVALTCLRLPVKSPEDLLSIISIRTFLKASTHHQTFTRISYLRHTFQPFPSTSQMQKLIGPSVFHYVLRTILDFSAVINFASCLWHSLKGGREDIPSRISLWWLAVFISGGLLIGKFFKPRQAPPQPFL